MLKKGVCLAFAENQVGHVYISGEISQDFHKEVMAQLQSPELQNATSIVLHIQSPGGSVYAGYNTFHVLRSSGKPITSIIEGEAQSMATFISLAGSKKIDARNGGIYILSPSTYMIHNPSQGIQGTADALQSGAEELRKIETEMSSAYAIQTGKSAEEMKVMMTKESRMTADEAKQYGFVDEVKNQLKAVAIGKTMEKKKTTKLDRIIKAIGEAIKEPVTAVEHSTTVNGAAKMILVTAEGQATMDGALCPDGDYPLQDGRTLSVAGGMATIKGAMPVQPVQPVTPAPVPTPDQLALKAAQDQLAAAEAAKVAAEQAVKTTMAEKEKLVVALGTIQKDVEEMKKETVGDDENPEKVVLPVNDFQRVPVAFARSGPNAMGIDASRTFIINNLPHLERNYPKGYFDQYKTSAWGNGPKAVSIVEPNFSYTYPGILTDELFYKPTVQTPAISDMVTMDQGISFQKKYNLVAALDRILKPYTGCGSAANANRALITNANLQTKEFRMYEGWCKDDFTQQLTGVYNDLAQKWLKTGERSFDPAGTPIETVINTLLEDALRRDIFRRFSFGASNSSSTDYNQIDGLWDRLIDSSGAANYCVFRSNTAAPFGTGALSAGAALTAFQNMFNNSNILLKQFVASGEAATIWTTLSLWENYYDSLVGNGSVSNNQYQALRDGIEKLTYKGIEIRPVPFWDFDLATANNPLFAITRHLALFTVKKNHIFGVENGADLNKIDSWFEKKDDKRYYRADMKFGYQYLHCDLQTIAY